MKNKFYVFTMMSALFLFGCGDKNTAEETETAVQTPVATEQENTNEETNASNEEKSTTDSQSEAGMKETEKKVEVETVITPEKAEEVVQNIVETAQEDKIVNDIKIDESKKDVTANITFNEDVTKEERGAFLFNYMLFLEKQYPDQEVKINIEK